MFPDFLGIGVQKAGTTWLHTNLSACDEIWLPHLKELHYFDRRFPLAATKARVGHDARQHALAKHITTKFKRLNFSKLRDRLSVHRWRDISWELRYLFGSWDDEWYESLFKRAKGQIAGEITPAYSCMPVEGIAHVSKLMPDAKLILLLRDPIERAWSHARMDLMYRSGRRLHEVDAREFLMHFDSPQSRARGDYLGILDRWLLHFPRSQLLIGYYDEIVGDPRALFTRILDFLGVARPPRYASADLEVQVNAGIEASLAPVFRIHLGRIYIEQLRVLADKLGPYPTCWLQKCESTLEHRSSHPSRSAGP
jgi:hypothetical protein